jgi:hypothetical protein
VPCCLVCKTKNICNRANMLLPDVKNGVMRRVNLCNKHCPPEHILGTITSFDELGMALRNLASAGGLFSSKLSSRKNRG